MDDWIRAEAARLEIDIVGFARVPREGEPFAEGERFLQWLGRGYAGDMGWLSRTAHRRASPRSVVRDCRSAVVLVIPHPPSPREPAPDEGRVASYARGRDYHNVLGRRVRRLASACRRRFPDERFHASVDTGPVLEKAWAVRAGQGWLGKNTLLLHPRRGSYALIGVILTSLELKPAEPMAEQCGDCRLCLDACPTAAFPEPFVLDARRCIAYLTIESHGDMPEDIRAAVGDHVFGCDVCQAVCPWNVRAPEIEMHRAFGDGATTLHESLAGMLELSRELHAESMRGRALARPGRDGLVRNAAVVAGNTRGERWVAALLVLLGDASALVRRHAAWALGRISGKRARAGLVTALAGESDETVRDAIARALSDRRSESVSPAG